MQESYASDNDGTKIYLLKRKAENGKSQNVPIKLVFLYSDMNAEIVLRARGELQDKNVEIIDGISGVRGGRRGTKKILKLCDYVVIFCSRAFLEDDDLMGVLANNYSANRNNDGNPQLIPIVIEEEIYVQKYRLDIMQVWKNKKKEFEEECRKGGRELENEDLNVLKDIQFIYDKLGSFVEFAKKMDPKGHFSPAYKIVKRIEEDRGETLRERSQTMINYYGNNVTGNGNFIIQGQQNGLDEKKMEELIQSVMEQLRELHNEEAENLRGELEGLKGSGKKSRGEAVMTCLSGIVNVLGLANGIPALSENLIRLQEYLTMMK